MRRASTSPTSRSASSSTRGRRRKFLKFGAHLARRPRALGRRTRRARCRSTPSEILYPRALALDNLSATTHVTVHDAVAHYLGLLSHTLGRNADAETSFSSARGARSMESLLRRIDADRVGGTLSTATPGRNMPDHRTAALDRPAAHTPTSPRRPRRAHQPRRTRTTIPALVINTPASRHRRSGGYCPAHRVAVSSSADSDCRSRLVVAAGPQPSEESSSTPGLLGEGESETAAVQATFANVAERVADPGSSSPVLSHGPEGGRSAGSIRGVSDNTLHPTST